MEPTQPEYREVLIDDLNPAEYNPRRELQPDDPEYENLKRSLEEFGYVDPLIINNDMTVIGGHQRLRVLKDLGYERVKVIVVCLDKDREMALNIALNKIQGKWDYEKLADVFTELSASGFDVELTGFSNGEIMGLMNGDNEVDIDQFLSDEAQDKTPKEQSKLICPSCGAEVPI